MLGSLGTALYRSQIATAPANGLSAHDTHVVHDTLAGAPSVASRLPSGLVDAAQTSFTHGISVIALVGAALMLAVATLLAIALRNTRADKGRIEAREPAADPAPA